MPTRSLERRATRHPPNEHVFYDLSVAKSVAATIADRLAAIDPANAADYRANAAEFGRGADAIATSEHAIATTYPSRRVIATEPVAHYLLQASGLVNRTPPAFIAANENGTDPSPADMAYVLDLINHRQVSALLVNPQTSTAAINGLQDAARRAGVPVTEVTETLPNGTDYLTWQRNTVNQLRAALRSSRTHAVIDQAIETPTDSHQPSRSPVPGWRSAIACCGTTSTCRCRPVSSSRCSVPTAPARPRCSRCCSGQLPLSAGAALVDGKRVTSGSGDIGYVPQHRPIDREVMLRGRDLVRLGIDGHHWGAMPLRSADRARRREAVRQALRQVNGEQLADVRVGRDVGRGVAAGAHRSGAGQRPDAAAVRRTAAGPGSRPTPSWSPALIDRRRREAGTTVIVVTHEINPILPYVDRVLYLVDGRFRIGTVEQVMNTETLSTLYRADIQVVKVKDRYVVVGESGS